jgi:hypothetical protein
MKYLLSLPGVGGYYGATIGAATNIINRIKKKDPDAMIHYSGVSSGAICALMLLILSGIKNNANQCEKKHILRMHEKFIKCINEIGKWSDNVLDYYHNNDLFFAGLAKFVKKYVKDVGIVNNRLHIGYCKVLENTNDLEFVIVSEFYDVDDLINALFASSHYSLFLRNHKYYEFRNQKCVDGVFMDQNVHLPDYVNLKICPSLVDNISIFEKMLVPCHDKFVRLYEYGVQIQKSQKKLIKFNLGQNEKLDLDQQENTDSWIWDIVSMIM